MKIFRIVLLDGKEFFSRGDFMTLDSDGHLAYLVMEEGDCHRCVVNLAGVAFIEEVEGES